MYYNAYSYNGNFEDEKWKVCVKRSECRANTYNAVEPLNHVLFSSRVDKEIVLTPPLKAEVAIRVDL